MVKGDGVINVGVLFVAAKRHEKFVFVPLFIVFWLKNNHAVWYYWYDFIVALRCGWGRPTMDDVL